jgi:hypothetical protein
MAHPDNSFYGHSRVLSEYAGLGPRPPVIWGHVQHGWWDGFPLKARLVSWLPKLVYNDSNLRAAAGAGIRPVSLLGAPFCYLERAERKAGRLSGDAPRSTIAYPFHGWDRDDIHGSHQELVGALSEREQGPVTVCLYWREYDQNDVRRVYEDAGFRVVCHGYRSDPGFARRQFEELLRHDRVVSNRVSTALWYGGLLGRELEVYGPVFSILGADEAADFDARQRQRWPDLLTGGMPPEGARELAASELGADHVREPEELRELLGWTPSRRSLGPAVRAAARVEHHVRRVGYNVALRLPRSEPLPRF